MLAEFGLGLAGLGAGAAISTLFAIIAFQNAWSGEGSDAGATTGLVLGGVITFTLVNAGINGGGEMTGGLGSAWWTALGTLVGGGAGAALGFSLIASRTRREDGGMDRGGLIAGMTLTPLLSLVGGILAYEVSDRGARRRRAEAVSLMPVAVPTEGGLSLGLAGRF